MTKRITMACNFFFFYHKRTLCVTLGLRETKKNYMPFIFSIVVLLFIIQLIFFLCEIFQFNFFFLVYLINNNNNFEMT